MRACSLTSIGEYVGLGSHVELLFVFGCRGDLERSGGVSM